MADSWIMKQGTNTLNIKIHNSVIYMITDDVNHTTYDLHTTHVNSNEI